MSDASFWEGRYVSGETGWDMGMVSPPLAGYIDRVKDKTIRILIPGCGHAYEAAYLLGNGFKDITLIDLADTPVNNLRIRFRDVPEIRILKEDFFAHSGTYDLILEQTFFCALDPSLRPSYVQKMHDLLAPGGLLVGLLFDKSFESPGPPFGGSRDEYLKLFDELFKVRHLDPCHNSHPKRQDTELFMELERRKA